MELYSSLKTVGKKALIGSVLLGSLIFGTREAGAEEVKKPKINPMSIVKTIDNVVKEKHLPKRKITLDFADPQNGYEANSNMWYSLNQVFARGDDYLGTVGLDDKLVGRVLSTLSICYFSSMLEFYSHEMAHNYEDRKYGERHGIKIDFQDWWYGVYPNFVQFPLKDCRFKFNNESLFKSIVDGLNQEEHNADKIWQNFLLEGYCDHYNSISFLFTKTQDLQYILAMGFKDEHPQKTGLTVPELLDYFSENYYLANDVDQTMIILHNQGIELTKEKYFLQALIADLLSWQTLDSFVSVYQYLEKGKRRHKPFTFNLGNNIKLSPPLINCYLTSKGTFYNANCFLLTDKTATKLSLGHDVDFIGGGKVNHLRFGGKFHSQKVFKTIKANPFIYLNFNRLNPSYKGVSTGVEITLPTKLGIDIRGKIEYNQNDILENKIKGEKQGPNYTLGIDFKF